MTAETYPRAVSTPQAKGAPSLSSGRGVAILILLCLVQFMDILDASILNIALPSIKRDLGFTQESLQWVVNGYILTYGGFLLLGGRVADLLGRRRVLVTGLVVFAGSSLVGGLSHSESLLVGARFAQGLGAAMLSPASLSTLTTSFRSGRERHTALGAALVLLQPERASGRLAHFDALGACLVTGGMLLLVYSLVKAPDVGHVG